LTNLDTVLLSIDTCGPIGTVALARVNGDSAVFLGQIEIPGGELSKRLVLSIASLLTSAGLSVPELAGIVAVTGPGSFTGIRVGLAAVKALAEAASLPVVAVSRLALLATLAKTQAAALDAHRGQVFLGTYVASGSAREVLMTAGDFPVAGAGPSGPIAFCEEAVAHLLETVVADVQLVRSRPPTAFDALAFALPRFQAGDFADIALLDGYYLRGADAKTQAALAARQS
jgi:tRNA threonylcarbamoyladenosine biosynthesis protein TsaB